MIKQVQKLLATLHPGNHGGVFWLEAAEEQPWAGPRRARLCKRLRRARSRGQGSRQAARAPPRPGPPRVSAVCADGWGSFSPTRQPAPACRASGPWSPGLEGARALSPPWAGAPAAPRSALCEPEDWHLGRRCPAPCQTWFCEVSAGIA